MLDVIRGVSAYISGSCRLVSSEEVIPSFFVKKSCLPACLLPWPTLLHPPEVSLVLLQVF